MKKALCFLTALVLVLSCTMLPAFAQPLTLSQPLAGESTYPDGSTEDNAKFLLTYSYPQITPVTETDNSINIYYQEVKEDLLQVGAPMLYDEAGADADAGVTPYLNINYQITANTDDFFSVLLTHEQLLGAAESQTVEANVFARTGDEAGGIVTLPTVLGFASDDEASATKAIDTVYRLVWDIIVEQMQTGDVEYFEELTQENLFTEFYPETDFYLDDQGNIVFYVEPSTIATSAAGLLTFPFSVTELVDEMTKN